MGLVGGQLMGFFVINGNLNCQSYLNMLQHDIRFMFRNKLPVWFQQGGGGAFPHNDRNDEDYL